MARDSHSNNDFLKTSDSCAKNFIKQVYGWLCFSILLTICITCIIIWKPSFFRKILLNKTFVAYIIITQFILTSTLSRLMAKLNDISATIVFILYLISNGITTINVIHPYQQYFTINVFLLTISIFVVMSIYGYVTNKTLVDPSNLFSRWLMTLVVTGMGNFGWKNSYLAKFLTCSSTMLFVALIAKDVQQTKRLSKTINLKEGSLFRHALLRAVVIYFNFNNTFITNLRTLANFI